MVLETTNPPGKGKKRCNVCKSAILTKEGDWFIVSNNSHQQVFLCKSCESSHQKTHKRATSVRS